MRLLTVLPDNCAHGVTVASSFISIHRRAPHFAHLFLRFFGSDGFHFPHVQRIFVRPNFIILISAPRFPSPCTRQDDRQSTPLMYRPLRTSRDA